MLEKMLLIYKDGCFLVPMLDSHDGLMLTHKEWDDIKEKINDFYSSTNQQYISNFNSNRITERNASNKKKTPNKIQGYIYILNSVHGYKIGRSITPISRVEHLGVKLPFPIDVMNIFPADDYITAERICHRMHSDKRLNGEWFALKEDDVEWFKSIIKFEKGDFVCQ